MAVGDGMAERAEPLRIALQIEKVSTHGGDRRYGGRVHGDLGATDLFAGIFTVGVDHLLTVPMFHAQMDIRQKRLHGGGVPGIDTGTKNVQADGAVHSTGIHVKNIQLGSQDFGDGAFSGTAGAVDGNGKMRCFHSFRFFLSKAAAAAPSPAHTPVANAICKLYPPV